MATPIIAFLAIVITNYFFPSYNYINLWNIMGKIGIVLSIAYVLTRTEGTRFENLICFMMIGGLPIIIFIIVFFFPWLWDNIIKFFPSFLYSLPWFLGIEINFLFIIGYNGWLCPHNWNSGETTRFCTKCHRTEINLEYLSYGIYQFQNIQTTKDLNKKYKKEHSIFPFLISLFFIESILYFLMMN